MQRSLGSLRQKAEGYDASRDPFDGDRVLRRVGFFALVERKLRRRASEIPHSGVEFSRDITERYLNDTHVAWTPAHDARLLAAVCCHGYGHFADVALDESFDLVPPPTLRTAMSGLRGGLQRHGERRVRFAIKRIAWNELWQQGFRREAFRITDDVDESYSCQGHQNH